MSYQAELADAIEEGDAAGHDYGLGPTDLRVVIDSLREVGAARDLETQATEPVRPRDPSRQINRRLLVD